MSDDTTMTREALARQLSALEDMQREVEHRMRALAEPQGGAPTAPWLARRGAANASGGQRTLPPWLARRGH